MIANFRLIFQRPHRNSRMTAMARYIATYPLPDRSRLPVLAWSSRQPYPYPLDRLGERGAGHIPLERTSFEGLLIHMTFIDIV